MEHCSVGGTRSFVFEERPESKGLVFLRLVTFMGATVTKFVTSALWRSVPLAERCGRKPVYEGTGVVSMDGS